MNTTSSPDNAKRGITLMTKVKIATTVIVTVLVVIVIFQNLQPVTTRLLFFEIPMSRALLLFVMLAIGFAAGVLVTGAMYRKRQK